MNESEKIAMLMFRHVRKELTRKEERELTVWRHAGPENERIFNGTTDGESILINIAAFLAEKERGLQKLKKRNPEIWTGSSIRRSTRRYWMTRIAAIILIVLSFGLYFVIGSKTIHAGEYKAELISTDGVKTALSDFQRGYLAGSAGIIIDKTENGELIYNAPNNLKKGKQEMFNLRTDKGGEFILKLPDSTMIWINSETSIKYPANFSQDTINISLEGEAYFEIAKVTAHYYVLTLNAQCPTLNVHTTPNAQRSTLNAIQVETSGGQFNLNSYSDDSLLFVTLINGSANLTMDSAGSSRKSVYELKSGQQARVINQNLAILSGVNTAEIIGWKNGRTIFRNADIQTIMKMVARWYNVDVNYKGSIPDKKFSINIPRNSDLPVLLDSLKKQGLIVSLHRKTVTILK